LAVSILPGIDYELSVADLHPAETLLVQDGAVHLAGLLVRSAMLTRTLATSSAFMS